GPIPITLRMDDATVALLADVVHCSRSGEDELSVGLAVRPLQERDTLRLADLCQSLRCPELMKRSDVDADRVAELMQASGYLGLRAGAVPSTDWHKLPGDQSLSVDSVYVDKRGGVQGHISCLRLYPRTWIYHQLATTGARRAAIA